MGMWKARDASGKLMEDPNLTCVDASDADVRNALFPSGVLQDSNSAISREEEVGEARRQAEEKKTSKRGEETKKGVGGICEADEERRKAKGQRGEEKGGRRRVFEKDGEGGTKGRE